MYRPKQCSQRKFISGFDLQYLKRHEDPVEGVPAKRMCQKMNNNFFYKAAS